MILYSSDEYLFNMKDKPEENTMINLLHIPEGVRDIYGTESKNKSRLENSILDCMHRFGYSDVETPTFEYFDIFNKERGTVPSKDMYKFFDKEGNTLVLRPDTTPAIARTAAKYYKDCVLPVRLGYRAKQFINHSGLQGKLKQTTQLGAELYNDNSVYADFELISLTIESLLACGVREFQLEIGDSDFYKGLVDEAGIDEEKEEILKEILEQKNIFALEDFVGGLEISGDLREVMLSLAELYGQSDILEEIYEKKLNATSKSALKRLIELYKLIERYDFSDYVSFDLSMLSKHSYYTGVFFRAITYGSGEPVAYGGRYNKLVRQFGYDVPAIGMSITVDYLLMGLEREKLIADPDKDCTVILFDDKNACKAIDMAQTLRNEGKIVRLCHDNDGKLKEKISEHNTACENEDFNRFTEEIEFADVSDIIVLED